MKRKMETTDRFKRQTADVRGETSNERRKKAQTSIRSLKILLTFHFSPFTYCLLTAACLLVLTGCDEPFQPLQRDGMAPFSMQGYVDASADTQWLRIIPARDRLAQPPVKPEMEVTLEHVESGSTVVMNDSLFQNPDGFNFVNVWTEMDVEPRQTYRLTAVQPAAPESQGSSVTVTTPADFPTPTLQEFGDGCSGDLRIDGVERLADVKSVWTIRFYFSGRPDERYYAIPYRSKAFEVSRGSYSVYINTGAELGQIMSEMISSPDSLQVLQRDIFIASGGPEWNEEITSLEELIYYLPDQFSNVENGVGYVIGIVSKTIPLDHCF